MQHYIDSVTAFNGDKVTNAVISVTTLAGNGVTIYLDEAGLMPVSFVNSDANGEFNFYIPSGRYNINVSGSSITSYTLLDVFIFYPNDDVLVLNDPTFTGTATAANISYTGTLTGGTGVIAIGTNQIYKDASGNVGIGTSSPAYKLDVNGDSHLIYTGGARSIVGNDNKVNYSISDSSGLLVFDWYGGHVWKTVAGTEQMRINSVGNVTLQGNISVGGAAPTTVGTGITFPAAQSASSDANTLDDYEEGVWTPVLTFATNGTMTYTASTASGVYTKIGNVVTCRVILILSAFTAGTASGQARISLPFTSALNHFSASTYANNFTTTYPTLLLSAAAVSYVNVFGNTAINTTPVVIAPANFSATSQVLFSITYTV